MRDRIAPTGSRVTLMRDRIAPTGSRVTLMRDRIAPTGSRVKLTRSSVTLTDWRVALTRSAVRLTGGSPSWLVHPVLIVGVDPIVKVLDSCAELSRALQMREGHQATRTRVGRLGARLQEVPGGLRVVV